MSSENLSLTSLPASSISYGSFLPAPKMSGPLPRNSLYLLSSSSSTLARPKKDKTATGVDVVCTHHPDTVGPGLDRERLYWELSQLTYGVTRLGPYTLDQESLYINGEGLPFFYIAAGCTFSFIFPFPSSFPLLILSFSTCAGYTHQTQATTPSSEYSVV